MCGRPSVARFTANKAMRLFESEAKGFLILGVFWAKRARLLPTVSLSIVVNTHTSAKRNTEADFSPWLQERERNTVIEAKYISFFNMIKKEGREFRGSYR